MSVYFIKLGIRPDRIAPGCPQQNGRHERMHRTLKAETTRPPETTMQAQQRRFDAFRQEFNTERPHEALKMATPASRYVCSERVLPEPLPTRGIWRCGASARAGVFDGGAASSS